MSWDETLRQVADIHFDGDVDKAKTKAAELLVEHVSSGSSEALNDVVSGLQEKVSELEKRIVMNTAKLNHVDDSDDGGDKLQTFGDAAEQFEQSGSESSGSSMSVESQLDKLKQQR